MSWIQSLFQRLKGDGEADFDEYDLDNSRRHSHVNLIEGIKDLDARISYQYPKDHKPLNPPGISEEANRPKRRARHSELDTSQSVDNAIRNPVHHHGQTVETKLEVTQSSRRPFHPTEIPSPVFGFNRPKKRNRVVEHELSHFIKDVDQTERDALTKILTEGIQEEKLDDRGPVTLSLNSEEATLEPTREKVNDVSVNPIQTNEEPEILTNEIEQVSSKKLEIEDEPAPIRKLEENKEEEPEVPPVRRRSHLPFNVMMLKQDRQKWETNRREISAKEQPQPAAVQVPPNQETTQAEAKVGDKEGLHLELGNYRIPSSQLLHPPAAELKDTEWLLEQEELLNETLKNFNVGANVVNVTQGPSVTRFEVQPEPGVKVNKITNLSDDIKLSLAAKDIRIEAPIPGKHTIGIEVPNHKSRPVQISEIIQNRVFKESDSPLTAVLGLDIAGNPIVTDLKKMPHGLIAGATGSGKSVCINSILVSLLYKARPDELKLMLIDPKVVELAPYNRIPHLVTPVITDVKAATAALKWAVDEMERRYELFAHTGVRDIGRFNELAMEHKQYSDKLPYIVIIIDELADLMMVSPADVEEAICRIAQKARACGIHLIVATQRPSVDVITGLIKANIPTRIAFSVSSQVDSRTIIDISGAEKLLGRGDMLFLENGSSKPVRLQGTFVSDEEIDVVVAHVREEQEPVYLFEQEELLKKEPALEAEDELFYDACEFIISQGLASTSSLQRRFKIGYNRAARLMDMLEQNGYITSANGSKPREVLISENDLESIIESNLNAD